MQPPRQGGATAQAKSPSETGRCNRSSQAVQPPRAQSPSETGRCNLLCQAVAPPELKFRALPGDAITELSLRALEEKYDLSGQEMHSLSSVFELWQRGATTSGRKVRSPLAEKRNFSGQEMHRLSSVFELWQEGATTPDREGGTVRAQSSSSARRCHLSSREVQPPELRLRALPGGATSPVKRCNRLIPEFRDLIVLSSKFELGWGL